MLEFDRIHKHFKPLAGQGALNLEDDAAVFAPPPNRELVIAADAMVAGVHFLPEDPPDLVARKLLRVNLSDLAAMGAEPLAYLMTVSVPKDTPDAWFAAFAAGLAQDQAEFGITLLGGDTTSTSGPVTLSLTVLGHVAPGKALRRNGARPGDEIWVTGTIGDGALGLCAARGELPDPDGYLADRYRLPRPRLGLRLHDIATACMDVSDGLIQDIGHICRTSGVGAQIEAPRIPLSPQVRRAAPDGLLACVTGGDDYELVLAVPPAQSSILQAAALSAGIPVTRIGHFAPGEPVASLLDANGAIIPIRVGGWSHF